MQFALPPRRSPHAVTGARSTRMPMYRRKQLKTVALISFAIISILFLLSHLYPSSSTSTPSTHADTAGVVIVTVLDRKQLSEGYIKKIIANREHYTKAHGYTNFFASTSDYEEAIGDAQRSWATVPAVRNAMATYPRAKYFFHLSPHALIMDPTKSLESHLLDKSRIETLMLKDYPVVPPDSIIKTFPYLKEKDIDLITTQDIEDLTPGSFVLRNGDFARFFLDIWFDPLFRSYNFAKAEVHGLDHILQWHPTVLARTALVPQRVINAYSKDSPGAAVNGTYQEGDFILRFPRCDSTETGDCAEAEAYYKVWLKKTQKD
ncbi:hypothetical protein N7495_001493 [Penicillium taxi]|uniref:uncharacterized protein n=1 Tax=Penicillium taxi TaxID=168475 RepID=UPI002544F6D8|nr:uncharacterized protein N7495_001493 [Penicillium taxi]KAJ5908811.1 hypothetical protein N7495_001493 [Penicillium taxi]